jgi:alpha-ketoglutarate-dependent taurine dioxygenase
MTFAEVTSAEEHLDLSNDLTLHGAVVIRRLDQIEAAMTLARTLGEVVEPGFNMTDGLHDGHVYSIEVRNGGNGVLDNFGHTILSTTNWAFALHTDGYNWVPPPHYVVLSRADAEDDEPLTHIVDATQALMRMDEHVMTLLAEPCFPSAHGLQAIVSDKGSQKSVRYNRDEIERWSLRPEVNRVTLSAAHIWAMDIFEEALKENEVPLTLAPGDCLTLDNWRCCHGRAALSTDSRRVLKRLWVV